MVREVLEKIVCKYQHKEGASSFKMCELAQSVLNLMDEQGEVPDSEEARRLYWEITGYKYSLYFNEEQNADLRKIRIMFSRETINELSRT